MTSSPAARKRVTRSRPRPVRVRRIAPKANAWAGLMTIENLAIAAGLVVLAAVVAAAAVPGPVQRKVAGPLIKAAGTAAAGVASAEVASRASRLWEDAANSPAAAEVAALASRIWKDAVRLRDAAVERLAA